MEIGALNGLRLSVRSGTGRRARELTRKMCVPPQFGLSSAKRFVHCVHEV